MPTKTIDIAEDLKWNAKKINAALLQSILSGDSIPKIASRLQTVTDMNKSAAIRNARTMVTSAENVGRINSMKDLVNQGVDMLKEWISTLDSRTRDTHLALNGKTIPVNNSFMSGLKYPGDPNGAPSQTYNCRCTLGYVYKGFSSTQESKNTSTASEFIPAKTTEEAEAYLKEKTGITANYKYQELDYANAINKEVMNAKGVFGDKLDFQYIESEYLDENMFKGSTCGVYDPDTGTIIYKPMTISESKNISAKAYKSGQFSTDSTYHVIRHELGHAVGNYYMDNDSRIIQKIGGIRFDEFKEVAKGEDRIDYLKSDIGKKELSKKLSVYAFLNTQEFLAESVAEYLNGKPRPLAAKVVNILLKG